MHGSLHLEACCGHRGGEGREPFAFPGTQRRYAPDRRVDIRHTRLELALDPEVVALEGRVTHEFTALADDVRTVGLHAGELTIERVEDDTGAALAFRHMGEDLTIDLPGPLAFGEAGTVHVKYRGTPRRGIYFIRPDADYPTKAYQVWTQGQDEDSRYWFPCFDHPTEKFSSEVLARVPKKYTVVSNGALKEKTNHDDETITWHWGQEAEHSAYLVTLCVGEFEEVHLGDAPVPLMAYVPLGMREIAERAFGRTEAMVAHFGERFGISYPYEKYAQVVVEDFIFGGMENTSATTLIDLVLYDDRAALDFEKDDLIAHELAHQWWGDLLTCREWPHAWLNEGFATWCQLVWREHHDGPDETAYDRFGMAVRYRGEDGSEYRRAIVDRRFEEPIDLFDRHLYEKGGLVLHMLRNELGESSFWRGVRTYAADNRGGSVVTEDLRIAFEKATGRNIEGFLDQWVYHPGHPELEVSWNWDAPTQILAVTVRQTQTASEETVEVFRMPMEIRVVDEQGRATIHVVRTERRDHTFHLPVESAPRTVEVDPEGHLLATMKVTQPTQASRATLASEAPLIARIRAAHALSDEPTPENVAALAAVLPGGFWGLAVEAAQALADMRTPAARDALVGALAQAQDPKTRRGIAEALGAFRHDDAAAAALRGLLEVGDPSMFVEAAAATALGKTRVAGARAILLKALEEKDAWAETIRIGCVTGLAELGDEGVVPAVVACTRYGRLGRLRAAAARALGRIGHRMVARDAIVEILGELAGESDLRIVTAAIEALRTMGDDRAIPILEGTPAHHPDGRVRRDARAAALRLRKSAGASTVEAKLGDEIEKLRKQQAALVDRLGKLEARLESHGGEARSAAASD